MFFFISVNRYILISLIPQQLLILVVALNVLGIGFKKYKRLSDKYIIIILLALGIVFSIRFDAPCKVLDFIQ